MRIAIEGCGHGTLHAIYASIKKSCEINHWNAVDLVIIGGDFQAVRNAHDLNTLSVPQKFRAMGDFHEYYSGARLAPFLTLFVGGNHEASSHLQELYYGGWVAQNIYYLGAANTIRFGDLRIASLSGIWKGYNYNKPHFERLPYTADEIKSLYHVREIDVRKLLLIRSQVDVGISHDWPRGIEWQGDHKALFRKKDLFEADARAGTLGSSAAKYVMDRLRPPHWFAAHLHCKFAAVVDYGKEKGPKPNEGQSLQQEPATNGAKHEDVSGVKNTDEIDLDLKDDQDQSAKPPDPVRNEDEIDLDMDDASPVPPAPSSAKDKATPTSPTPSIIPQDIRSQLPASFSRPPPTQRPPTPPPTPNITNKTTSFLALDKCLPNRKFLQILEINPLSSFSSIRTSPPKLAYDPEWLSILRVFASHDPHTPSPQNLGEAAYAPLITKEEAWVEEHLIQQDKMRVPENFQLTAPVYDGSDIRAVGREQPPEYTNPQTKAFCAMLGISNFFDASEREREEIRLRKGEEIEAEARAGGGGGGRGRGGAHRGGGGRGRGRGRGRERGRGGR